MALDYKFTYEIEMELQADVTQAAEKSLSFWS
jgi:hypothetical protein